MHQSVATASVEANAQSGIKMEGVVPHQSVGAAGHQQRVLVASDAAGVHVGANTIFQVYPCAIPEPLVAVVVVVAQSVGIAFVFPSGVEFGAVVVGKIAAVEQQILCADGQQRDFIAFGAGISDRDIFSVYEDGHSIEIAGEKLVQ